jgi:protein TonB
VRLYIAFSNFVLLCCSSTGVFSQKNNSGYKYFAFDRNWKNISNLDSAAYFARLKKVSDTCYEVQNYNMFGPMISKEVYKDAETKIAHGTWIYYKANGYMDSICNFRDNLAHGKWYYTNDTNRVYKEKEFENGKLKAVIDVIQRDSINKAKAALEKKVERDEKESEFPGGISAWTRYLTKNFRYPDRAYKNHQEGMVVVQFVVNTEGEIEMVDLYKSVEYTLDDEARRLIIKSPKWTSAFQDGKKVKSYKRQPVIFKSAY